MMEMLTRVALFPVSVCLATTKWGNDDALHTSDKKYDEFFPLSL